MAYRTDGKIGEPCLKRLRLSWKTCSGGNGWGRIDLQLILNEGRETNDYAWNVKTFGLDGDFDGQQQ